MSRRLSGINPLSYLGVEPYTPPAMLQNARTPTSNDFANVGDFWIVIPPGYSGPESLHVLISLNAGVATWAQLYPGGGSSLEFETDSGSVVPALGIVNVLGDGVDISTTGSGNTITINLDSDVATSYPTDSGTAAPMNHELEIFGGSNINTSGVNNTVTVNLNSSVTLPGDLDVEGNTFLEGNVTILPFNTGVVQSNGSGELSSSSGTNGQLLIGSTGGAPAWANITSTGATVTITNGASSINLETAGGGGGNTIVSQFSSSATWNKNVATQYIEVYGWCAGGGGAGGDIPHPPSTNARGGGGGGSYGVFYFYGPSMCFDNSVSVTIGSGGIGGAGIAAGSPNPGGDGGASFFGDISTRAANNSGPLNGSGGGNNSSLSTFGVATPGYWGDYTTTGLCVPYLNSRTGTQAENWPGTGGFSPSIGLDGSRGVNRNFVDRSLSQPGISFNIAYGSYIMAGTGGGGAGLVTTAIAAENGGDGGSIFNPVDGATVLVAGGAGGDEDTTIDGGNGIDGVTGTAVNLLCGGSGGGGGGNQASGLVAGNGGNGGFPGGGGGGGGAARTTTTGSGGNGADGLIIVIEYL